jgi:hypothetical protein
MSDVPVPAVALKITHRLIGEAIDGSKTCITHGDWKI